MCPKLFSCCCDEHNDQKQFLEEEIIFGLQVVLCRKFRKELKVWTWRKELRQRSYYSAPYWLAYYKKLTASMKYIYLVKSFEYFISWAFKFSVVHGESESIVTVGFAHLTNKFQIFQAQ